jgi:hypothetical protein
MSEPQDKYHYYLNAFQRGFAQHGIELKEVGFDDLIPEHLKEETSNKEQK